LDYHESETKEVVMDQDLKQYLDRKFAETEAQQARLVTLISEVKDSLEREINTGFEEMDRRFHIQATRLDRQAALLQTGSRWTNRMKDPPSV
jgi:hypothetical protein